MKLHRSMKRAQCRAQYRTCNVTWPDDADYWLHTSTHVNNYRRLRKYYALRVKP